MADNNLTIDHSEVMKAVLEGIGNTTRQEWIDMLLSYGMTLEEIENPTKPVAHRKYARLARPLQRPMTAKKPSHF